MKRLWFVVPVHGREDLTRVCLRQLRRTCDQLTHVEATAVVIGEGKILRFARRLGFATVERDNTLLGRKFNDGYQLACDPDYNPRPADWVVPCGSDDWIDPRALDHLPGDQIGAFRMFAAVNETRTRISRMQVGYAGGVGVRVIPRRFVEQAGYRPAEEDRKRACDTSTLVGLSRANRGQQPPIVYLDRHELQIVDWKSTSEQLNSYADLGSYRRGEEQDDPFTVLAGVFPRESLEEMRAL